MLLAVPTTQTLQHKELLGPLRGPDFGIVDPKSSLCSTQHSLSHLPGRAPHVCLSPLHPERVVCFLSVPQPLMYTYVPTQFI